MGRGELGFENGERRKNRQIRLGGGERTERTAVCQAPKVINSEPVLLMQS